MHDVMGIDLEATGSAKSAFSNDILKIEMCGPTQEHFSVVDVPGIFRVKTEGVTTDADKAMVESMVRRYMLNPRSIILTVVSANIDIATQEILTYAEEADPDGHRTLGVLTKPDLVDPGAEDKVIDLVNGKRHKLVLGWSIVRNLGQHQLLAGSVDRDALETIFFRDTMPWSSIDSERVGINSLRVRLQQLLTVQIRREFPKASYQMFSNVFYLTIIFRSKLK